jgi:hypothetical protein
MELLRLWMDGECEVLIETVSVSNLNSNYMLVLLLQEVQDVKHDISPSKINWRVTMNFESTKHSCLFNGKLY